MKLDLRALAANVERLFPVPSAAKRRVMGQIADLNLLYERLDRLEAAAAAEAASVAALRASVAEASRRSLRGRARMADAINAQPEIAAENLARARRASQHR